MSKENIKVGTITAHYNNSQYLKECLTSILNQTYKPRIVCIVDDCSKEEEVLGVLKILDDLGASEDVSFNLTSKITEDTLRGKWRNYSVRGSLCKIALYTSEKNGGPAAARNIAVKRLKDYLMDAACIVDSDDVLYPTKIEKSVNVMKKYSHVGLVYSDYDILTESTGKIEREFKEPFDYRRILQECIVSNNSVVTMKVFDQIGLYDEELRGPEDYDLWMRISDIYAVYHIPEALYKYRVAKTNLTVSTPKHKFAEHVQRVYQKAQERLNAKLKK